MSPAPALPAQALPPDKRPERPAPFHDTLPSGLEADWRMPDPWTIIMFDGVVPDPITAATIQLLKDERQYTPDSDPRKFRADAASIRGMYGLAAAMLESPRLDVSREYGDGATLGRREIGYLDVCQLYWHFRTHTRIPAGGAADPGQPGPAADPAPDRDGVRDDTGGAAGDS